MNSTAKSSTLGSRLEELLELCHVSLQEREMLFIQLSNAIVLQVLLKLGDKIPKEHLSEFETSVGLSSEAILLKLQSYVTKEEFEVIVAESARDVLTTFVNKI